MKRQEQGFTLVEIAIVLVIIGLLLGGILKGQELINSARVRNLADTTSGIQAAYFGFVDRYRRVPGDWDAATAQTAIGGTINGGGNNNGRIDHTGGGVGTYTEPNALWEHLSKAGFINGSYDGGDEDPTPQNNNGPFNPFNGAIVVATTDDYLAEGGSPTVRLHLVLGRGIPVDIARELDTKLDDSVPDTGSVRATVDTGATLTGPGGLNWGEEDANCVDTSGTPAVWDVGAESQDCNIAYLF